jgi:hypothetical protein
MTTSGTTTFNPNIIELLEEAYERAGLELRSGYDLKTGIRSFNFLMAEWANRGLNLWTITEGTVSLASGDNTADINNIVDLIDYAIRTGSGSNQTDYRIERVGVSQWAAITNKNMTGRPVQIYVERLTDTTRIKVWPVPSQDYTLVYWALSRMDDAGAATNTADMPYRFIPALVSGLAYHIATKKPAAMQRVPFLKQEYEEQFRLAADEDRDRSSVFFLPDVS